MLLSLNTNGQLFIQSEVLAVTILNFERPNSLPCLHRGDLSPCILPARRTDSIPSCASFGTSLIENIAWIWTLAIQLDSSQRNKGRDLQAVENGTTLLCPASSFSFFLFAVKEKKNLEKRKGTVLVGLVAFASSSASAWNPEKIICRVLH